MPRIIEELQGLSMYAWVTTAYMLDLDGLGADLRQAQRSIRPQADLVFGVVVFLAGSALCGLSGEFGTLPVLGGGMMQLVVFRAVQGLGAGALMTVSFAVMADLYPPRERGRLFGVFGSVFGLATVIGPFIGGFFTDHGTVTLLGSRSRGLALGVLRQLAARAARVVHDRVSHAAAAAWRRRQRRLSRRRARRADGGAVAARAHAGRHDVRMGFAAHRRFVRRRCRGVGRLHLRRSARAAMRSCRCICSAFPTFRIAALASFVMSMAFLGVVMFMPLYMQVVQGDQRDAKRLCAAAADGRADRQQHHLRPARDAHRYATSRT